MNTLAIINMLLCDIGWTEHLLWLRSLPNELFSVHASNVNVDACAFKL